MVICVSASTAGETLINRRSPATYLCFRGPLVPLLLLAAAVCAVWNELSVYKLVEGKKEQK